MAQSIIGQNHVLPYKFSECSRKEYMDVLRLGEAMCLLNKPNEVSVPVCQVTFTFLLFLKTHILENLS